MAGVSEVRGEGATDVQHAGEEKRIPGRTLEEQLRGLRLRITDELQDVEREPALRAQDGQEVRAVADSFRDRVSSASEAERSGELDPKEWISTLAQDKDRGYQACLPALDRLLIGESQLRRPTMEETIEILQGTDPDQLRLLMKILRRAVVQVEPVVSSGRFLQALKSAGEFSLSRWGGALARYEDERDGTDKSNDVLGWRVAITEGGKFPKVRGDNSDGLSLQRSVGIQGMSLKRFLLLLLQRDAGVLDTIIDEAPQSIDGFRGAFANKCTTYGNSRKIYGWGKNGDTPIGCYRPSLVTYMPSN